MDLSLLPNFGKLSQHDPKVPDFVSDPEHPQDDENDQQDLDDAVAQELEQEFAQQAKLKERKSHEK